MSYAVNGDELFSDDDSSQGGDNGRHEASPPSPKRPRNAIAARMGSGLSALDSLNLGPVTSRPPPMRRPPPRGPPPPRPIGGFGGGFGGGGFGGSRGVGGVVGREGGGGLPAIGSHMRPGAAPPSRGRPGIHPSRLMNLQRGNALEESMPRQLDTTRVVTRDEAQDNAMSILSEADRARLRAREQENIGKHKRPGRRRSTLNRTGQHPLTKSLSSIGGGGRASGGGAGGMFATLLNRAASGTRVKRPEKRPQVSAVTAAQREQERSDALMGAVLGNDALARQRAKDDKEREARKAEIEWQRVEARRLRQALRAEWAKTPTVARSMRDMTNLGHYERDILNISRHNFQDSGLSLKVLPNDEVVDSLMAVEMADDI